MKKASIIMAAFLCLALITGCSSNDSSSNGAKEPAENSTTANDKNSNEGKTTEEQKGTIDKQKQEEKKQDQKQSREENSNTNSENNPKQTATDKNDAGNSKQNEQTTLADTLKMDNSLVKRPTAFPVNGDVTTNVTKDTSNFYSIDYRSTRGELVATFSGTHFPSNEAANRDLNEFMSGKEVPKNMETATDLGYGIRGYSEGAAGHGYFGWTEGNWTFNIAYITEDKLNSPEIAKKMVNYLEKHSLPAPKAKGIVALNYPKGANSVDVDIRWQENDMVYRLNTNKVPLDALSMTVSVK